MHSGQTSLYFTDMQQAWTYRKFTFRPSTFEALWISEKAINLGNLPENWQSVLT